MYKEHQPKIAKFGTSSSENMGDVLTFVLSTIQNSLDIAVSAMPDIRERGEAAPGIWGFKVPALRYINSNHASIYKTAMDINDAYADPVIRERELLKYFGHLPGLGLVKGGFAVQLLFGVGGCLDTHNINRFGVREYDVKASRFKSAKTEKTKNMLLDIYQDLLQRCGGCETLWDSWCEYVADNQPDKYKNSFEVSKMHCNAFDL